MTIQSVPSAATGHYRTLSRLQRRAVTRARRAWAEIDPRYLSASWREVLPQLTVGIGDVQLDVALEASSYSSTVLAQRGDYELPASFADPTAFVGVMDDGGDLSRALYSPIITTKRAIAGGATIAGALEIGRHRLDRLVGATVRDTARGVSSVDITTRTGIGYVRMINPPSCDRCAILAGRFYRWNAGFDRHPSCRCTHVPSKNTQHMRDEGLIADPYEYFHSLSREDQVRIFGKSESRAIRDGADIFQVTNARRGMTKVGTTPASRARITAEGTGRRGNFRTTSGRGVRRSVDEIYRTAGTRTRALRMLEEDGYILPGGQNPAGVLRGQREGFGALGRGGTRRAATNAVLEARRTGRRDPTNRYTMTEAERAASDAERNWRMVQMGLNPYSPDATRRYQALMAGRPVPRGLTPNRPLTDDERARAENDYRTITLAFDPADPAGRNRRAA